MIMFITDFLSISAIENLYDSHFQNTQPIAKHQNKKIYQYVISALLADRLKIG